MESRRILSPNFNFTSNNLINPNSSALGGPVPPGSESRITDSGNYRITDNGNFRVTDA